MVAGHQQALPSYPPRGRVLGNGIKLNEYVQTKQMGSNWWCTHFPDSYISTLFDGIDSSRDKADIVYGL